MLRNGIITAVLIAHICLQVVSFVQLPSNLGLPLGSLTLQHTRRRTAVSHTLQHTRRSQARSLGPLFAEVSGSGSDEDSEDSKEDGDKSEENHDEEIGKITKWTGNQGMSIHEGSLPLSFRSDNGTRDNEFYLDDIEKGKLNPYFDVVRRLSPSELIGRFMRTGSPRIQEAVKNTVMSLLGTLPMHAFDTMSISSSDALANLMFHLQMTGYLFKNAEYRLTLKQSLRGSGMNSAATLEGEKGTTTQDMFDEDGNLILKKPKLSGKVRLTYESGQEIEVDADAYMAEIRSQVEVLQNKLLVAQEKKNETQDKDLLAYIKSLPEAQLKGLTADISPEVLESMKLLVETVMRSFGAQTPNPNNPNQQKGIPQALLLQQTGNGMAQLCMWQLAIGYNLREMEAREELKKKFRKS